MKILFQGDSITDGDRDRSDCHNLGEYYPKYAAQAIKDYFPAIDFEFINYGVGGNKVADVLTRTPKEIVDVQPDIVSVLVGINDTWHRAENKDWLDNEIFESQYREILEAIKTKTHAKIIMIEPYLLPAEDKLFFREDLDPKIQVIRKLAAEYADMYIPLDGLLAAQCVHEPYTNLSEDGVHPTRGRGSEFIGKIYADCAAEIIEQIYNA